MSDMFGAPAGIEAGLERERLNTLTQLSTIKTVGDLAELPGKLELQKAHARYYNAEAADKETEAGANRFLGAAAAGMTAGDATSASPANPLYALSNLAFKGGYIKQGTALLEKAANISLHEQQLLSSQASQELRNARTQDLQMQETASLASALNDPATYTQRLLSLAASPNKTPAQKAFLEHLPETYEEAKPLLEATEQQAIKASDAAKARAKALVDAATIKAADARAKASLAAADASRAITKVREQRYRFMEKNDGDVSAASRESKLASAQARRAAAAAGDRAAQAKADAQAAKDRKNFPPPTPEQLKDPSKLTAGQPYSTPKGVLVWTGKGWIPMAAAPVSRLAPEPDDNDDDGEDDLDD